MWNVPSSSLLDELVEVVSVVTEGSVVVLAVLVEVSVVVVVVLLDVELGTSLVLVSVEVSVAVSFGFLPRKPSIVEHPLNRATVNPEAINTFLKKTEEYAITLIPVILKSLNEFKNAIKISKDCLPANLPDKLLEGFIQQRANYIL